MEPAEWVSSWFFKPGGATPSGVAEQILWGHGRPLAAKNKKKSIFDWCSLLRDAI